MSYIISIIVLAVALNSSSSRPIQDQGSSPYCLFAVTAYLTQGDMWDLAAEYHRRNLRTVDGRTPEARRVIDLAGAQGHPMTIASRWDSAAIQRQVQRQPVAVTGQGHALVIVAWKNGVITYRDSLNAKSALTMSDRKFWAWWDGWGWWKQ